MLNRNAEFAVVWVTNNLEENPEYREDTEMYPHLVDEVEDEIQGFVVDLETGDYWVAEEFFDMESVKNFVVTEVGA